MLHRVEWDVPERVLSWNTLVRSMGHRYGAPCPLRPWSRPYRYIYMGHVAAQISIVRSAGQRQGQITTPSLLHWLILSSLQQLLLLLLLSAVALGLSGSRVSQVVWSQDDSGTMTLSWWRVTPCASRRHSGLWTAVDHWVLAAWLSDKN